MAGVIELYEQIARARGVAAHELPVGERHALARSLTPGLWPGWSTTDGTARGGDVIEIVAYDPSWPARFEQWRGTLQSALRSDVARIEHVGSTSVPGLAAKPIVDVQVSAPDLDDERATPTPRPR